MATTQCWKCGTPYEGWSCPSCATTKAIAKQTRAVTRGQAKAAAAITSALARDAVLREAQASRTNRVIAAAARDITAATEEAAEKHRESIANAWNLESRTQSDRAREMLDAGLADDALHHAEKAIGLDRANLAALVVAAAALERLERVDEAREHCEKAIQLLRLAPYPESAEWHQRVCAQLRAHPALVDGWCDVAIAHIAKWQAPGMLSVVGTTLALNRPDVTEALIQRITPRIMSPADRVTLAAYIIENDTKTGAEAKGRERAAALVAVVPYTDRGAVSWAFDWWKKSQRLRAETIEALRQTIAVQYGQWRPALIEAIRAWWPDRISAPGAGCLAWVATICLTVLLYRPIASRAYDPGNNPEMIGIAIPLLVASALCAGLAVNASMRMHHGARERANYVAGLLAQERHDWEAILAGSGFDIPTPEEVAVPPKSHGQGALAIISAAFGVAWWFFGSYVVQPTREPPNPNTPIERQ